MKRSKRETGPLKDRSLISVTPSLSMKANHARSKNTMVAPMRSGSKETSADLPQAVTSNTQSTNTSMANGMRKMSKDTSSLKPDGWKRPTFEPVKWHGS